jgi:hypothetical protein
MYDLALGTTRYELEELIMHMELHDMELEELIMHLSYYN